jgi:integration host factor subunit alpha
LKTNPERDVALSERVDEFDGAIGYADDMFIANASFTQSRESGRAFQSTILSQVRAVADAPSSSLTKADLADLLFEQVGLNKREAKDMVETFFDELNSALERGESVKLTGFGNFQLRDKVSRPGRNPKTGVEVHIPARRVVTFHASQKLKDMVNDDAPSTPHQHDER